MSTPDRFDASPPHPQVWRTLAISCEGRDLLPRSWKPATPWRLPCTTPRSPSKPPLVSFIALFDGAALFLERLSRAPSSTSVPASPAKTRWYCR